MQSSAKIQFLDANDKVQEATVSVEDYRAASEQGLSLSLYLDRKFNAKNVVAQALDSCGLCVNSNPSMGIQSSSMRDVFNGVSMKAGAIVAPDGTGNTTPAGRIFYPEVILQTIAAALEVDNSDYYRGYEDIISGTENVNAPEFKRARIDLTAPEASEAQSIAQLAEPPAMVTITAADSTTPIPSKGIGLMVSDQALATTSFDLVNTVMSRQARGEKLRSVNNQLNDVLNGNTDLGITALSTFQADTLDPTIVAAGVITQKAWIHYLRDLWTTLTITNILCTVDTALAIEGRTGRPNVQTDDPTSPRIDSLFSIDNLGLTAPRVFLVDATVVPENHVVGLDREFALRRYRNVSASYEATEAFIMRRAQAFRVDSGETLTRLFDDAFRYMTLTV